MASKDQFDHTQCEVDGRSLHLCETLLAVKQKLGDREQECLTVLLSGEKARDDIMLFARDSGFRAQPLGQRGEDFLVGIGKRAPEERERLEEVALAERPRDSLLLISSEGIGPRDQSLGRMLMMKFLYSITETRERPTAIVIVSGGVRLTTRKSESLEALRTLESAGVDIMVCRPSAEFLALENEVAVGRLCNMYQIVERLLAASKTLTV
jgi:selenium metabolism protein YedF